MKKVCINVDCSFDGKPQPEENFYKNRKACKTCVKKEVYKRKKIRKGKDDDFYKNFAF